MPKLAPDIEPVFVSVGSEDVTVVPPELEMAPLTNKSAVFWIVVLPDPVIVPAKVPALD
jgi:hypothetical protein